MILYKYMFVNYETSIITIRYTLKKKRGNTEFRIQMVNNPDPHVNPCISVVVIPTWYPKVQGDFCSEVTETLVVHRTPGLLCVTHTMKPKIQTGCNLQGDSVLEILTIKMGHQILKFGKKTLIWGVVRIRWYKSMNSPVFIHMFRNILSQMFLGLSWIPMTIPSIHSYCIYWRTKYPGSYRKEYWSNWWTNLYGPSEFGHRRKTRIDISRLW